MDRSPAQTFRDSIVWQKAHQFVLAVYHYSDYFPQKEIYGLTSRLRQAAISIAASIAEGVRQQNAADQERFLKAARDAVEECRYYLILATDLGYGDNPQLPPQLEEVYELLGQ